MRSIIRIERKVWDGENTDQLLLIGLHLGIERKVSGRERIDQLQVTGL